MKYYLAPLEGVTTSTFRSIYHKYYPAMDKYFTPFLSPHSKKGYATKEKKEILPEYNEGMYLVPQILTNNAQDCLDTIGKLKVLGYDEVNLNLGCPSKTVVSKKRGSGFLAFPEEMDQFLDEVVGKAGIRISVKTRIGKDDPEEFPRLLEIYNQYPLEELIIHPRIQKEFYKGKPHLDVFEYAVKESKNKLCYNGDIFTAQADQMIKEKYPSVDTFMLGRGIISHPWLLEEIKEGKKMDREKFREFHDELFWSYEEMSFGEKPVLFKMKEIWSFTKPETKELEKAFKKLRKAESFAVYNKAAAEVFALLP